MKAFFDKIMGKAFSCCSRPKRDDEEEQIDETTRLLASPKVSVRALNGFRTNSGVTFSSSVDVFDSTDDSIGNNNDENKTVEKELAKNLIDITSMDRPIIDKCEWEERVSIYEKRMARIKGPLLLKSRADSLELPEEPIPKRRFQPIEAEDLELITTLSQRASDAVLNGFKIESKDSIIADFKPWKSPTRS